MVSRGMQGLTSRPTGNDTNVGVQMIREYGGRLETPPLAEVIARRD
jgi:hypothetical protein